MDIHFVNEVIEQIWSDRYRKNNESYSGNLHRVAKYCAKDGTDEQDFFSVMDESLFFPAGRTMSNSNIGKDLTLNNCFLCPRINDSLDSIFDRVKLSAKTHQKGGGIGDEFSYIRPAGTPTSNDAVASGPVSFMNVFNAQTKTILAGNRRGANMGCLSIYHPDIEEFIYSKSKDSKTLEHFNLSVVVDDKFMKSMQNKENIFLHWPVYDNDGNIIYDESKWKVKKEVNAYELWNKIIKLAYNNGEPGIFFYDTIKRDNPISYVENILSSNPCGEFLAGTLYGVDPISGRHIDGCEYGGACNLGSIMVHNFVKNPFTKEARFDYDNLCRVIKIATKFLDNIIDVNKFPEQVYENYQKSLRSIGLGITGLADALAMLGMKYNSKEALVFTDNLVERIAYETYSYSIELSKKYGQFPFLDRDKFCESGFLNRHIQESVTFNWLKIKEDILKYGIRNSKMISIAPTGTMSIVYGNNCSSGIEPIFSLSYDRKIKVGGQDESNEKIISMEDYAYHIFNSLEHKDVLEDVFTTAMELSVDDHINMLSKIANHVDMGISKTINVPTEYPFEDTKKIYEDVWKLGIKGCTIFRPNDIRPGILITKKEPVKKEPVSDKFDYISPIRRRTMGVTHGDTFCKKCACGTLYVTVNRDDSGNIVESFVHTSKGGICQANISAVNRMVSLSMRSGVKIEEIVDQLRGINCPACTSAKVRGKQIDGLSCPDIMAKTIESFYNKNVGKKILPIVKETVNSKEEVKEVDTNSICPECGAEIRHDGSCITCPECGWSHCGG